MRHPIDRNRHVTPTPVVCSWALVFALTLASAGCGGGGGNGREDGSSGNGSGGGSGGAELADGGRAPQQTGADGGGTDTPVDMCSGAPCADHTGARSFTGAGVPADAESTFASAQENPNGANAGKTPAMIYPANQTMFPINVSRIRHEWSGAGNDLFRLRFKGPKTVVDVFESSTSFVPSAEQWDWIAESNRGADVTLTVTGLSKANPSQSWTSAPITLSFSNAEVEGAIYYWSTGSKGVMRALVSDPIPQKFYTDPNATDAETCVACHTLSRDGKRMAAGYGGETLREISVPDRSTLVPSAGAKAMPMSWATFTPDGKGLLVASGGALKLIDSDTGKAIGSNEGSVPLPSGKVGTHPDFHPKGDRIVLALGTKGGDKSVEGASIAVIPYLGDGKWGTAKVLLASAGSQDNNFFPVWSPDGRWIAYVNTAGSSKDAPSAVLRLISADGGEPVTLTRLNTRVNANDGVTGIGNTMPTWAPATKPGTFWLAFSSLRAYATVRPQATKEDQIWIAAIDPSKEDPSYPAFWAPFQSIEEGNHRAFWTHTDSDTQCLPIEVCGDDLDNDCNGVADDNACVMCQPAEICGDGKDNDCDGVVDDCTETDCTDSTDNDRDGLVDSSDPDCAFGGVVL